MDENPRNLDVSGMRPKILHRYLRAWRESRGMSQEAVGHILKIRHSTVSRWERGLTPIDIFDMERLAAIYGVPPAALITDPAAPPVSDEVARARSILSKMDDGDRADWLRHGERLTRN